LLRLPKFTYLRPRSVDETVEMLATRGPAAMPMAGGTDLLPKMKRGQFEPSYLVGLLHLAELHGISDTPKGGLRIGAGQSLTSVAEHPEVRRRVPALATAAQLVATSQIRAVGTIGGNALIDTRCNYIDQSYHWRKSVGFCLKKDGHICPVAPGGHRCWAISSSDTAPVLIALGAKATLVGTNGQRTIEFEDLYRDDGAAPHAKSPDEILVSIEIPAVDGMRCTYLKLRRRGSFDFPILGVAAALSVRDGFVERARVVLGGVASLPIRARAAETLLVGKKVTPELMDEAAQVATNRAKPLDNADLTHFWRKRMSRVYARRALREVAGLAAEA